MRVWPVPEGGVTTFRQASGVRSLAAVAGTDLLLVGRADGVLTLWGLAERRPLYERQAHADAVVALGLHPDGRRVLTGSADASLRLVDLRSGEPLAEFRSHPACAAMFIRGDLISSTNLQFAYHGADELLGYGETRSVDRGFHGHASGVTAVAITPNGRWACSASADGTVRLWDLKKTRCVWIFGGCDTGDRRAVAALALTAGGTKVLAAAEHVHAWRIFPCGRLSQLWGILPDRGQRVTEERADLMVVMEDALIVADRFRRSLRVCWRRRWRTFPPLSGAPLSLTAAAGRIAVGCEDGTVWLFRLDGTGESMDRE